MTTYGAMRILLVEDNPGDLRLLQEHLAEGGAGRFKLTNVDRLSAGLERLAETSFDVVLLDLSLPDSQGLDTVVRMRAASKHIPIVVLTGVEDEELGVRLVQAGAQDYLVKGQVTGHLLTQSLRYAAERARMEEALHQSERRLRGIMDNSPALMFLKDMEGRYLLVNRKFEEVIHLQSRNLIGKTDEEIFPPTQAAAFRANDRRVLEAGKPMEFEEVALHDDGPHTSIVVKFPLVNPEGKWEGLCGIATDITDRKRAEEALRESEVRYHLLADHQRAIMDNLGEGLYTLNTQGLVTYVNPAAEELFGYTASELLGHRMHDVTHYKRPDGSPYPIEECAGFQVLQKGAELRNYEDVFIRKGGSFFPVTYSSSQLRSGGNVVGLVVIFRDITEQKRVEEERRKLVNDKLLLLDSTAEGIYGVDLEGRCTFVNKAAAGMFGYQPEQLLGKDMHGIVHHHRGDGSPYPFEECRIYAAFRTGRGCQVNDEVLWRKDGTTFPAEYSSFPVIEQGVTTGAVVTFTDITERKWAEEQLRDTLDRVRTLSQRLEAVREEERTRIARELHDELGVRLTCLKLDLARLQSMKREAPFSDGKMEEKIRAMVAEVDATIASVQRLVVELRPGILDDLGLVAAIEWQCQDFERRSGIRCLCEASEETIDLDSSRATAAFRICQEGLTNVARHAKATFVRVQLTVANETLLLEIQDNGKGISAAKVADSASLGLLGMRERASSLGGQVEIAGWPGKGTTLTLQLPLKTANAARDERG